MGQRSKESFQDNYISRRSNLLQGGEADSSLAALLANPLQTNKNVKHKSMQLLQRQLLAIVLMAISPMAFPQQEHLRLTSDNVDEVIALMTPEEKVDLCIGIGAFWGEYTGEGIAGAAGGVGGNARFGFPRSYMADSPQGLRISKTWPGATASRPTTSFPAPILLASTWDVEATREVGAAIGEECKAYGVATLLAPAINIVRFPLSGRTAEYFTEDPLLNGRLATAYTQGVQSQGVGTSVKHFAANSQETARKINDARVSERALREVYLRGFEMAVKEADPWTVMSSYNKINGIYASANSWLLEDVLRGEWGFQGMVMTDWDAGVDGAKQLAAGNDLCQPGRDVQRRQALAALESGELTMEALDRNVRRLLLYQTRTLDYRQAAGRGDADTLAHAALARRVAAEGIVLLQNRDAALPMASRTRVAVYGDVAYRQDGEQISLMAGLADVGLSVDQDVATSYRTHLDNDTTVHPITITLGNMVFTNFMSKSTLPEQTFSPADWQQQAARNDYAVVVIGHAAGEGLDNEPEQFELSEQERELIEQACSAYHLAGRRVVVALCTAIALETASWRDLPDAIVCVWQGGQEQGHAVADVLSGRVNPSGRLTITFPLRLQDEPAYDNFPLHTGYNAAWTIMGFLGEMENAPWDEEPVKNVHYTNYDEGIYIGYRHFDARHVDVAYPFGFGLSYTTFTYSDQQVQTTADGIVAKVCVTNTGLRAGREVVQLYVAAPTVSTLDHPAKELRGFAKTRVLQPGESEWLTIPVTNYMLSSFDETSKSWVAPAGTYIALFAASATDVRCQADFQLKEEFNEDLHSPKLIFK